MNGGKVLLERSLSDLQDNIVKLQVVWDGDAPELPEDLQVVHRSKLGRIYTLIVRGNAAAVTTRLSAMGPLLVDAIPLTLEEIFIYELGGEDYAVRDILL